MAESLPRPPRPPRLSFFRLFQYARGMDYVLILVGTLGAMGMGIIQPLLFLYIGRIYSSIDASEVKTDFYDKAVEVAYLLIIFGFVYTLVAYIAVVAWVSVGSRQSNHFRERYMEAVLRQDPEWFDKRAVAELPNILTSDTIKIERSCGDKLVMIIFTSVMVISAIVITIVEVLQLLLVALPFAVPMTGGLYICNKTMERNAKMDDTSYREAGGIAEEALTEIKTVAAHNAQEVESTKYIRSLTTSYRTMLCAGLKIGLGLGIAIGGFLGMTAAIYVTGATLIRNDQSNWATRDDVDVGSTLIVCLVCMMAFNNVGILAPCIKLIIEGTVAAGSVMEIINNPNKIISGKHKGDLQGVVEFKHVNFAYPSAPTHLVLSDFTFSIRPGDTLAILGETGSGKSTVVSLLMRFYDPVNGEIMIDGVNLRDWDLDNLRSQVGLVSQEPILFNATIKENIRFGLPDATDEEIEDAVKQAEVWESIQSFDDKFETKVGSKGSQLSGGERQRIAIARAIIRKPKLLLLDESTSALDKITEAAVQVTLNNLMSSCTTLMIAHRISTIRKATKVIVISKGCVQETGTQEELRALEGKFYHLTKMQNIEMSGDGEPTSPTNSTTTAAHKRIASGNEPSNEVKAEGPQQRQPNYGKRVMQMTSGNCKWVLLGTLGAILVGVAYPVNGMLLGLELKVLGIETGDTLESDSRFYGGMLGICAGVIVIGMVFESVAFPLVSARATRIMRKESFKSLLTYDLAFFDLHNATVLGTQLNSDCEKVNGLGGQVLGLIAGVICSLITAFTISGVFCWQIMLVVMAIFPMYVSCVLMSFLAQAQGLITYTYEDATIFASDCILNYKTVKAFGMETYLLTKYMEVIEIVGVNARKRAHYSGFSFGLGYGFLFFLYALMFWFAAYMFKEDYTEFDAMNVSLFAALSGTSSIFLSGIFAPDMKQGQQAAKNLFQILDYEPSIDASSASGEKASITGAIRFDDVSFSYPTRDIRALAHVSFTAPAGSTFAIVGTTGSGKSTVIQLLLRFYDVSEGAVYFDNTNIKDINIRHLRSQIGIVSQEPVLFSGSIATNIAYGYQASDEEIHQAAEQAQALTFIDSHEGFSREVGIRGTRLSGGEKQRIAIARAIVRKPKILILDEATSALDSDTEAKISDVLRGVMMGRTCVLVAHRIKTIANMDQIMVLSNGNLIEMGSFNELMEKKGFLFSLAKQQ